MKKTLLVIALVCAALGAAFAQEGAGGAAAATMADVGLLNLNTYSSLFLNGGGRPDSKYFRTATDEDWEKVASLGGKDLENIDTPLEIALLSTCAGVVDVRPVEASNMLGTARQADLKLGSAVLKELTEIKFLDPNNRDAVGRYEGIIKFITDRGNVSRAEIESYYRQGIGALIAEAVDAEFNKISFLLENSDTHRYSYNAVLAYESTAKLYVLSYKGNGEKIISAPTLSALSSEMRNGKYKADFDEIGIQSVNDNAALIPAVVYAEWKTNGATQYIDAMELLKEAITKFYVTPNQDTYQALLSIESRYYQAGSINVGSFANAASIAFSNTLKTLVSETFSDKVWQDAIHRGNLRTLANYSPPNRNYDIFSVVRGTGGGGENEQQALFNEANRRR